MRTGEIGHYELRRLGTNKAVVRLNNNLVKTKWISTLIILDDQGLLQSCSSGCNCCVMVSAYILFFDARTQLTFLSSVAQAAQTPNPSDSNTLVPITSPAEATVECVLIAMLLRVRLS